MQCVNRSDIQIADFQGMFFNEFAARFHFVAHQHAKHLVGGAGILHGDLYQRAVLGVEGCLAEFFGVHFPQSLEAGYLHAFLAGSAHRRQQAAQFFQRDLVVAATQDIARFFESGALLWDEGLGVEAIAGEFFQARIDGSHFVELGDLDLGMHFGMRLRQPIG